MDFHEKPEALEESIAQDERQASPLKQGAQASIVWYNEEKKNVTPYSIVYLHGFKGSRGEGHPVHRHIAKTFGCNLYLSRLYGHGQIKAQKFDDLTPHKYIRSAKKALNIGRAIGDRVLIMGTSTGGLLGLYLASLSDYSPAIAGLILYSPLIHFYGMNSLLLEHGPSRSLLRLFAGSNYQLHTADSFNPDHGNIWYRSYHLNGALALGKTVQKIVSPALFRSVTCPVFLGYYYKSRHSHDRVVSTSAIRRAAKQLGTPPSGLTLKNFPEAGSHVICSSLLSYATDEVTASTEQFLIDNITSKSIAGNI
jgi:pimeloyl-ACP methyl ester carboxylesterase